MPKEREKEAPYRQPPIEKGMIVAWYADGSSEEDWQPAVVSAIGHETICVNVVVSNSFNTQIRDGVRHLTDPKCQAEHSRENGGWDYTPAHKRLLLLEAKVEQLCKELLGTDKG